MRFEILAKDGESSARAGRLSLPHGEVLTPVFMPVGTQATVKTLNPEEVKKSGAQIILANTYHLYLRPGIDVIRGLGGLHSFMGWGLPILTDSGGFQIFSLNEYTKASDEGVSFKSYIDGTTIFWTPEEAVKAQAALCSDIMMVLDVFMPYPCERQEAEEANKRTILWAERSINTFSGSSQSLFAIVQGSVFKDLRAACAERLIELGFEGYAIGGLGVGEGYALMEEVVGYCTPLIPSSKPRYLMGIGMPQDILMAVGYGVDMFDCILPTRNARGGGIFTMKGKYNIRNGRFKDDKSPLEDRCECYTCRNFSKAYIRHLFNVGEILGLQLASMHNLFFYHTFLGKIRDSIIKGRFSEFKKNFLNSQEEI